jgi:hypothetical protein
MLQSPPDSLGQCFESRKTRKAGGRRGKSRRCNCSSVGFVAPVRDYMGSQRSTMPRGSNAGVGAHGIRPLAHAVMLIVPPMLPLCPRLPRHVPRLPRFKSPYTLALAHYRIQLTLNALQQHPSPNLSRKGRGFLLSLAISIDALQQHPSPNLSHKGLILTHKWRGRCSRRKVSVAATRLAPYPYSHLATMMSSVVGWAYE